VVVATALSSRHAAACAEAVRWQIGQALEVYRGQAEAGSPMAAAAAVAAPPDIAGAGTGSDWLALDTGGGVGKVWVGHVQPLKHSGLLCQVAGQDAVP
jgi:hypothetical protein